MLGEHKGQEIRNQDTVKLVWEVFWFLQPERALCSALDMVLM